MDKKLNWILIGCIIVLVLAVICMLISISESKLTNDQFYTFIIIIVIAIYLSYKRLNK
jgi:uncharacterized membrane protein